MSGALGAWDGAMVGKWLDSRLASARLDQATADRRGYKARDDYDMAAAEEWVCTALAQAGHGADRSAFAKHIKELLARDEYPATGIHDDQRFERHVRANLRKLARMTKANEGFGNMLRHQG